VPGAEEFDVFLRVLLRNRQDGNADHDGGRAGDPEPGFVREAMVSKSLSPNPFHLREMTGRAFFSMLIFVGFVVVVMWFAVLPALTTFRPTLP
jgi:hypothetical protein